MGTGTDGSLASSAAMKAQDLGTTVFSLAS